MPSCRRRARRARAQPRAVGALHALSTLRHLMQVEHTVETGEVRVYLPICDIHDKPVHLHRALVIPFERNAHLLEYVEGTDAFEGTTRSELSEVLQWIDIGASLKFNVLHWEVMVKGEQRFVHLLDMIRRWPATPRGAGCSHAAGAPGPRAVPARPRALPAEPHARAAGHVPAGAPAPAGAHAPHVLGHPPVGPAAAPAQQQEGAGGVLTERLFDDTWDGSNAANTLLRFRRLVREDSYLRLMELRRMHRSSSTLRGGGLEVPSDGLPLFQVASFLWDPATMVIDPTDFTPFERALKSVFVNSGLPLSQPHVIEAEQLRAEAAERIGHQTSQSCPSSPHQATQPDATRTAE